jgi:hypothetical protein
MINRCGLSAVLFVFASACGARAAAAPAAPPSSTPPEAAPELARVDDPPRQPPPGDAPATPPPCKDRRASFTLARATGMGSYITALSCSGSLFTIITDRATPDGREVKSAFQVSQAEWEKAWRTLEGLRWRTLDDRCTEEETARGRGEGPVYRITIDDGSNKRSFTCAGMRELAGPLDALQQQILLLAPADAEVVEQSAVGVKECDDYLQRYEVCVNTKVPAAKRQGFLEAIRFTRQALREALMRNPDSGEALGRQCKEMHGAARSAMASFKCKM